MNTHSHLLTTDEVTLLHAKLCRAIGDPKRLQILYLLADAPCSVNRLAELLDTPQSSISRHLATLRESGMVTTARNGTSIIYALAVPEVIDLIDTMRTILRTVLALQTSSLGNDPPV